MRALFGDGPGAGGRAGRWAVDPERTLPAVLGLRLALDDEGNLGATLPVGDHLKQPMGVVHGGVYAAIAETLASVATARDVAADGAVALGQANNTSFFRPVTEGTIRATTTRRHRGRTSQVWQVDMFDDAGRLAASSTVTIAVRAAAG
jgi:uncharacterized protein (TIGR00369 family)